MIVCDENMNPKWKIDSEYWDKMIDNYNKMKRIRGLVKKDIIRPWAEQKEEI